MKYDDNDVWNDICDEDDNVGAEAKKSLLVEILPT